MYVASGVPGGICIPKINLSSIKTLEDKAKVDAQQLFASH
jgi:hypothetical protein